MIKNRLQGKNSSDSSSENAEMLLFTQMLPLHILQTISFYLLHDVALFNWAKADSVFHEGFRKASHMYKKCLEDNWFQLTGESRAIVSMEAFKEGLESFACAPVRLLEIPTRSSIYVRVKDGTNLKISDENALPIGSINVCTRTENPFPRVTCSTLIGGYLIHHSKLMGYFEVTVPQLEFGEMVSIGVTTEEYQFHRTQVGWGRFTPTQFGFGWHSDDNGIFMCSSRNLLKTMVDFPDQGGTIGVGVQKLTGGPDSDLGFVILFLTCNGELVRVKKASVLPERSRKGIAVTNLFDLYPAVGLDTRASVNVNLGTKPFRYDIDSHDPTYFKSKDCYIYSLDPTALSR